MLNARLFSELCFDKPVLFEHKISFLGIDIVSDWFE